MKRKIRKLSLYLLLATLVLIIATIMDYLTFGITPEGIRRMVIIGIAIVSATSGAIYIKQINTL